MWLDGGAAAVGGEGGGRVVKVVWKGGVDAVSRASVAEAGSEECRMDEKS